MAQRDGAESVSRDGTVVCRARPAEDVTLQRALRAFSGPRMAWTGRDGTALVGCGVAAELTADGADRFASIRAAAADLFAGLDAPVPDAARPRLLGGFAFHDGHDPGPPWTGFPDAYFVLPRLQAARTAEGEWWLTAARAGGDADAVEGALDEAAERIADAPTSLSPPPGIERTERTPSRAAWRDQVRAATDRIAAGDLQKVVLAQALTAHLREPFRLSDTLARLAETYADCYRFAVDPGMGAVFFGATPERLVDLRDTRVETEALAGSIERGETPAEDERLADRLATSPKDRHEHHLVVEAIRDRLEELGATVTTGDRAVRRLATVQHLNTPIAADLAERAHVLELVAALHPTPAVGGLPPEAAWRTIKETESFDRGWYAAPVGWFDEAGDGAFAVGIRSAVAGGERATLFAGNGIVADSDPDEEWEEVQLKYRPMLDHLR